MSIEQTREAIASWRSEQCPSCGAEKKPRFTLCAACYQALPKGSRNALYVKFGQGYEEARDAALAWLAENRDGKDYIL